MHEKNCQKLLSCPLYERMKVEVLMKLRVGKEVVLHAESAILHAPRSQSCKMQESQKREGEKGYGWFPTNQQSTPKAIEIEAGVWSPVASDVASHTVLRVLAVA